MKKYPTSFYMSEEMKKKMEDSPIKKNFWHERLFEDGSIKIPGIRGAGKKITYQRESK